MPNDGGMTAEVFTLHKQMTGTNFSHKILSVNNPRPIQFFFFRAPHQQQTRYAVFNGGDLNIAVGFLVVVEVP